MTQFKRPLYHRAVLYSLLFLSIGLAQAISDVLTLYQVSRNGVALERNWVQGTTLLGNINFAVEAFRLAEVQRVLAFDTEDRSRAETDANERRLQIAEYTARFDTLSKSANASQLAAFGYAWAHYQQDHNRWIDGGSDAMALPNSTLDEDDKATDAVINSLVKSYSNEGAKLAAAMAGEAHRTMLLDLIAALLCVSCVVLVQLGARRDLAIPLQAITEAMTLLAAGVRDTAVPGRERRDEIGAMAEACEVFRLNVVALDYAHEAARRAEEQAQMLARHDALTGLSNRRVFSADLEAALVPGQRANSYYALMLIDLDDFKKVNDIQGHQAGDLVLCTVAQRLKAAVCNGDTLARLGGDEFAIITQGGTDMPGQMEHAKRLATRLLAIIRQPIEIGDTKAEVGASIGIATFATTTGSAETNPTKASDVTSILRSADIAMYRAKQSGRLTFRFFEQSMDDEMRAREALERDVARAIADGSIRPHYQPLVDIGLQRIRGFEALARWNHPVRGPVAPDQFIPIIEQLGLTAELSSSILRQACRDARNWPDEICIAINVSPIELKDEALPARFALILHEEEMAPQRLEVEITETALVSDLAAAKTILTTLQAQGITISLDDFGTGYSSLYHLRELKFDKVKIDRSFVQAMRGNPESEKIIDAILGLTSSLHLPTVAEGIEDTATLRMLTAKGCELGQGYYFGKAMPASAITELLARGMGGVPA